MWENGGGGASKIRPKATLGNRFPQKTVPPGTRSKSGKKKKCRGLTLGGEELKGSKAYKTP